MSVHAEEVRDLNSEEEIAALMEAELTEYVTIEKDIAAVRLDIKAMTKRKKELGDSILKCMQENGFTHLKANNGYVTIEERRTPTGLNKEIVRQVVAARLDDNQAEEITEDLFRNRPMRDKTLLKVSESNAQRGGRRRK